LARVLAVVIVIVVVVVIVVEAAVVSLREFRFVIGRGNRPQERSGEGPFANSLRWEGLETTAVDVIGGKGQRTGVSSIR